MTIVPTNFLSSASSQPSRSDAPRKAAEPFVLPPEDKPPSRPAPERKQAEPSDSAPPPQRAVAASPRAAEAERAAQPSEAQGLSEKPTEASAANPASSAALVGLQEGEAGALAVEAKDNAEATALSADLNSALLNATQQQADTAAIAVQQAQVAVQVAGSTETAADEAAAILAAAAAQADAVPDEGARRQQQAKVGETAEGVQTDAAGNAPKPVATPQALPGGEPSAAGEAAVPSGGTPGAEAKTPAAKSGDAEAATAPTQPERAQPEAGGATDKKTDQAGASAAVAKNELVARLEQSFAQPVTRPAETAPALPPAQSAAPELPKAIPPSAVPIEIGLRSLQGLKEFQIRLDPAELGRVDVKLEIGDDKSVTARVVVDRVETLHLLQREAKTLERAFEQAGLKSSDAGVDISLRDPGQQGGQGRREGWSDESEAGQRERQSGKPAIVEMPIIPIRRTLHAGALDRSI